MEYLKKISVGSRLAIAGSAMVIGLLSIAAYTILEIRNDAIDAHKSRIRDQVSIAEGIIGNYQKLTTENKESTANAQAQAKEALRSLRFGNNDYYFLYDLEGRALMVAGSPQIEGKIMLGKTDQKGFKLWDAIVEAAKGPGQGFIRYEFPRAGETASKPKLAYVKAIPEWKWVVGTGVYIDDVDETLDEAILKYSGFTLAVLMVMVLLGVVAARSITSQLGGEPSDAQETMRKIANGELGIDIPVAPTDNTSLMASLKLMQMKLVNLTSAIQESAAALTDQIATFDKQTLEFGVSRSDEDYSNLQRSINVIGRTANVLVKSIARFRT